MNRSICTCSGSPECGFEKRIVVVDVQFVGALCAIRIAFVGHHTPIRQGLLHQGGNFGFAQNSAGRVQTDAVVGSQKIEKCDGFGRTGLGACPVRKRSGRAGLQGMQHQGRQGKIIDQLGFVDSVAEIGNVVFMRYVGLADQQDLREGHVQGGPDQLDNLVGLGKVDTRGADFLPQVCDGIQADKLRPSGRVKKQRIQDIQQYIWIMEIQVDLVGAERSPHGFTAGRGVEAGQQRQRPRPDHL